MHVRYHLHPLPPLVASWNLVSLPPLPSLEMDERMFSTRGPLPTSLEEHKIVSAAALESDCGGVWQGNSVSYHRAFPPALGHANIYCKR